MPPTLISQSVDEIKNFFKVHQDIITKPFFQLTLMLSDPMRSLALPPVRTSTS